MTKRQQLTTAATSLFLFLSGGAATAADDAGISFAREVDTCIAQVNEHADYNDATRVRHTVVEIKNTFAGYVLAIDTDVFADSGEVAVREYASYCVAKGASKPKRFSIDKVSG